jgi:hypothetical protein
MIVAQAISFHFSDSVRRIRLPIVISSHNTVFNCRYPLPYPSPFTHTTFNPLALSSALPFVVTAHPSLGRCKQVRPPGAKQTSFASGGIAYFWSCYYKKILWRNVQRTMYNWKNKNIQLWSIKQNKLINNLARTTRPPLYPSPSHVLWGKVLQLLSPQTPSYGYRTWHSWIHAYSCFPIC